MAMAAVRFAARRLTAQQPQAILRSVVANEQQVVNRGGYALRRFTSSEASAANGTKISTHHPSVSGDRRLMAADQKKEELFDLLDEIQRNKDILYTGRKKDRWLLESYLARQSQTSMTPVSCTTKSQSLPGCYSNFFRFPLHGGNMYFA